MKNKEEIIAEIKKVEKDYSHILVGNMATIEENAPRALMQLQTTAFLDGLYFVLGRKRPKYKHER